MRARLLNSIRSLKDASLRNRGFDSAILLSHPDIIPLTLKFVTETGRFPDTQSIPHMCSMKINALPSLHAYLYHAPPIIPMYLSFSSLLSHPNTPSEEPVSHLYVSNRAEHHKHSTACMNSLYTSLSHPHSQLRLH